MTTTPTGTVVLDERNRRFLVLPVAMAYDESTPDLPDDSSWCAHVSDPASPLAGLYAFAASVSAARDAIAELAWEAVTSGELRDFDILPDTVAGMYVVVTTTEVYDADVLTAAINHDAA